MNDKKTEELIELMQLQAAETFLIPKSISAAKIKSVVDELSATAYTWRYL